IRQRDLRPASNSHLPDESPDGGIGEDQSRSKDHQGHAAQHEQGLFVCRLPVSVPVHRLHQLCLHKPLLSSVLQSPKVFRSCRVPIQNLAHKPFNHGHGPVQGRLHRATESHVPPSPPRVCGSQPTTSTRCRGTFIARAMRITFIGFMPCGSIMPCCPPVSGEVRSGSSTKTVPGGRPCEQASTRIVVSYPSCSA